MTKIIERTILKHINDERDWWVFSSDVRSMLVPKKWRGWRDRSENLVLEQEYNVWISKDSCCSLEGMEYSITAPGSIGEEYVVAIFGKGQGENPTIFPIWELKRKKETEERYNDSIEKLERNIRDLRNENREKEEKFEEEIRELRKKYEEEQKRRESEKTKYFNEKLNWERKEKESDIKITKLSKDLENSERDRDNQVGRLEIKLDEKSEIIRVLNDEITNLKISQEEKNNEICRKDEKIEHLKRQDKLSREELLSEKSRLKEEKLKVFATEFGISLIQINSLRKYYERLIDARKNYNQANIETHEDNISLIEEELNQHGFSVEYIQKLFRKCEKLAKIRIELSEIRQQQYEARQEILTN